MKKIGEIMDKHQTPISSEKVEEEQVRNWLDLPSDILANIFLKLGGIDILLSAQAVCPVWRNFSKQPMLFHSIDLRKRWGIFDDIDMQKVAEEAVDRSCGQLVEFSMSDNGSKEVLEYVADKSGALRCLRLDTCNRLSPDALMNMAKKVVLLEELEITHCFFLVDKLDDVLKSVGKACPQLKSFQLNHLSYGLPHREASDADAEALAIAENMPQLRFLRLFENTLTNVGLRAILDGCLQLESLDLRRCFNVNLKGCVLESCRDRHINVRLPNDSTDDCHFNVSIYGSYYRDLI